MKITLRKQRFTVAFFISMFVLATQLTYAYEENREIKNFNDIAFSISGDLILTQGSGYSVKLEGDKKDIEKIITKLEGNTLIIKLNSNWKNIGDVKVYVTLPELNKISLAGSGNVIAKKAFKVNSLDIDIAGSGDIIFENLTAGKTEVSVAGSGDIKLVGSSGDKLEVSIAGSGDVDAANYIANKVEVDISGSGTAKVHAKDKLETAIVGSGSVYYNGNPLVEANSIGSGRTKPL